MEEQLRQDCRAGFAAGRADWFISLCNLAKRCCRTKTEHRQEEEQEEEQEQEQEEEEEQEQGSFRNQDLCCVERRSSEILSNFQLNTTKY